MSRRLGKDYSPQDIRTATFKLSHEKWEAFQSICRAQNRSASDVLLEFVESILEDEKIPTQDDGVALAIANLEKEIAAINSRLDALDSKDDGLPPVVETEPLQPIVEGEENVVEEISQEITEPVEAETLEGMMAKYPRGISQSKLADRFDIRQSAVGKQIRLARDTNNPGRFIKWSRGYESKLGNSFAWQCTDDSPNLFPVP